MRRNYLFTSYFGDAVLFCSNIAARARTPAADEAEPVEPPADEGGACTLIGLGPLVAPLLESGFRRAEEEPVELRASEEDAARGLSSSFKSTFALDVELAAG